jgi:hypothetical protein
MWKNGQADRRADMTKLIAAFGKFENWPNVKNGDIGQACSMNLKFEK